MLKLYMEKDDCYAYHWDDEESDIYLNLQRAPGRGYKKIAKYINKLFLRELICHLNPHFSFDDCTHCPITRIIYRLL